jgi:predicted molibdopterin-dependent oxidoreductase YjgC
MLDFVVEKGKIKRVLPNKADPVSEGKPCLKGLSCHESLVKGRIMEPLVRQKGKLLPVSWGEAYTRIKSEFSKLKPEEIGFYGSGMASNEANYLLQKFAREVIRTNNIDSSARLCHSATLSGFNMAFGLGAMSANMDDLKEADCILIIGSDPKSDYPVAFNRILQAKEKGAKIIVVEDGYSLSSEFADIHVEIKVGMFLPIINFLAKEVIDRKAYDSNATLVNGFFELSEKLVATEPEELAKMTLCKSGCVKRMADAVCNSKNLCIMYGMALTQHVSGTKNVLGVTNLALLKKGKVVCMRGKSNIQGCGDMGCSSGEGDTSLELFFGDKLKAIYVLDSNIAQSFPELEKVHRKMRKMFVVYQGVYKNLMVNFADVVLPATNHLEDSGTMTNAERRVRSFHPVVAPLCGRSNWEVIKGLFSTFGKPINHKNVWDTTKEITSKIPAYTGITLKDIETDGGAFADKLHKKEEMIYVGFTMLEEESTKKRPFLLTTTRLPWQFVTGDMSRRSKTMKRLSGEPTCFMNPKDMKRKRIKDGSWVCLESECSRIKFKVKRSNDIKEGNVAAPFHYEKYLVNKLLPFQLDPISREPNLRLVDVSVTKAQR